MDDVWDQDAECTPSELKKVEREHSDAGYLKGITQSKEQAHQPGFDEGYVEGADIGLSVGRIMGSFQAMGLHDLETMVAKELSPRELFCSTYFNDEARPLFQGRHPLIIKWQTRLEQFTK